jgi:hypothetical protein
MPDIIDVDTGSIITGDYTIGAMGERVLDLVLAVEVISLRTRSTLLWLKSLLVDALPNPACTKLSAFVNCETFFRFHTPLVMRKSCRALGNDRC